MRKAFPVVLLFLVSVIHSLQSPALGFAAEDTESRDYSIEIMAPHGAGPHPAILLMHGCAGLTPAVAEGLAAHARYFRKQGFVTAIVDSFCPREKGDGKVCESLEEIGYARY
jgi:dienelactone hydrolase